MLVKMLDGPFAGEIKDLRSDVGLEFVRQKRAERAFQETRAAGTSSVAKLRQAVRNVVAKAAGNKNKR